MFIIKQKRWLKMIQNKNDLKIGKIIVNQKNHFKRELTIVKIDDKFIYCALGKQNTVMPIEFYLNKQQFSLKNN